MIRKRFADLTVLNLQHCPIWEFVVDSDETGDLLVESVENLPVDSLSNRIVGVELQFADGQRQVGFLGNVSLNNSRANSHFLTVTVTTSNDWFTMSRYFDTDYARNGPKKLAEILGKSVEGTFPIRYDISSVAVGDPEVIHGRISLEPEERLSEKELIELAGD